MCLLLALNSSITTAENVQKYPLALTDKDPGKTANNDNGRCLMARQGLAKL